MARRVLVAGGHGRHDGRACEAYDPRAGAWLPMPPMRASRRYCSGCTLPDGRFVVSGGKSAAAKVGFGRVAVPGKEAPDLLLNLV
jgi:hypothetical protein